MGLTLGPVLGRLGGRVEWIPSGVTGTSISSYVDVATATSSQLLVVEVSTTGSVYARARVNGESVAVFSGLIVGVIGGTISVNLYTTAVRYALIDLP